MEPIGNPETSVLNDLTPRNNPEDRRIQSNQGGSQRSHNGLHVFKYWYAQTMATGTVIAQWV
jgi:hypothetical protein